MMKPMMPFDLPAAANGEREAAARY